MASQVEAANRALSMIGEARITSFSDNSKAARAINAAFNTVRDSELRKHRWSFAIKRDSLAASVTPPTSGYVNQFPLPTDCLRVLQVGDYFPTANTSNLRNGPDQDWVIEGRNVLSDDAGPLTLRYIASITDTSIWDSMFLDAFSVKLAYTVADELTASLPRKQSCAEEYERQIRDAIRANAIELPPSIIPDDTWVTSRIQG